MESEKEESKKVGQMQECEKSFFSAENTHDTFELHREVNLASVYQRV